MNKNAQALGRMNKGRKKILSPEERVRRQEWCRGLSRIRWQKSIDKPA